MNRSSTSWRTKTPRQSCLDGVIVHSPATIEHDDVGGFVRALMRIYARRRKHGKVLGPDSLIHLKTCRLFAPDAFFVDKKRAPTRRVKRFEGSPNLALEVLSRSNRDYDLEEKHLAYRAAAIPEIWFIDPLEEQVIVDRKQGREYVTEIVAAGKVSSDVLPGFWLKVDWLWRDPLPDELDCLQEILGE
jgi:Uma2 family endonuclease